MCLKIGVLTVGRGQSSHIVLMYLMFKNSSSLPLLILNKNWLHIKKVNKAKKKIIILFCLGISMKVIRKFTDLDKRELNLSFLSCEAFGKSSRGGGGGCNSSWSYLPLLPHNWVIFLSLFIFSNVSLIIMWLSSCMIKRIMQVILSFETKTI